MQRFPRAARLLVAADFTRVFERRSARRGRYFTLHLCPRSQVASDDTQGGLLRLPRLGVVVPKKLLKKAVQRNRVKRIVREAFRVRTQSLPEIDLVVRLTTRPPPGPGDRSALADDIRFLLDRLPKQATTE